MHASQEPVAKHGASSKDDKPGMGLTNTHFLSCLQDPIPPGWRDCPSMGEVSKDHRLIPMKVCLPF
jgi:hypothetical protein